MLNFLKEKEMLRKRLIVALVVVSCLVGYAMVAQAAEVTDSEGLLDPFALTAYSVPTASAPSSTALVSGGGESASSSPITVRQWVRIPYHPHLCSPWSRPID
jgi:hypothetical protein